MCDEDKIRLFFLFLYLDGGTYYHARPFNYDLAYYTFVSYKMITETRLEPQHKAYPSLVFYVQLPFLLIPTMLSLRGLIDFWFLILITRINVFNLFNRDDNCYQQDIIHDI